MCTVYLKNSYITILQYYSSSMNHTYDVLYTIYMTNKYI